MHTESKMVPDISKIRGHKPWYVRRHQPVTCPVEDHFFLKQALPGSRSLPGSESLHLPSSLCFRRRSPLWVLPHEGLCSPQNYCRLHLSSSELPMWQKSGHEVALVQCGHHVSCAAMPRLMDCTWASES